MQMKTLTINGQTFVVVDADAMRKLAESDLNMNGKSILNAQVFADQLSFPGRSPDENVAIVSGTAVDRIPMLFFSGYQGSIPVLRNIHDGVADNDAATVGQVKAVDLTKAKTLTPEQQAQIRKNAGALGNGDDPVFAGLAISDTDSERGAWISPEPYVKYGNSMAAVLEFFGVLGDEPTVLRNVVCVDAGDAANKGYVDNLVGDIETALDRIIAIQESLIGGASA